MRRAGFIGRNLFHVVILAGLIIWAALVWHSAHGPQRMRAEATARGLHVADLTVREIRCSICRVEMTQALRKTRGVADLEPSGNGLTVVYDEHQTSPERLAQTVSALGFQVSVVQ